MNLQESFDTNKPPESKKIKVDINKRTISLNAGVILRFSFIFFFLAVFLYQVIFAVTATRAVKEDVAMQNNLKSSHYQAAIDDPSQLDSLSAKLNQADASILAMEDDLDVTINGVMVASMVSIFFMGLLTFTTLKYIKKNVVEPLYQFHDQAEKLAEGDLNLDFYSDSSATEVYELGIAMQNSILEVQRVTRILNMGLTTLAEKNFKTLPSAGFRGDFAPIEASFHELVRVVSTTMQNIVRSADEVNQGASHVANGAQNLAEGTTEQAESVERLSDTIAEMTQMVNETADSVKEANKLGEHAENVLESSSKEMGDLMDAIEQIEHSSSDIEQIIKTIDDIAFQTNILALNAAIEAARAGQFGKSFAVVADEVRSLAQKSADAAQNTNGLIDSSLEAIRRGASLAKSTDAAFGEAKESSGKILDVVRNIANSSEKQAVNINTIQQSVSQISAVISSNSATSEQSAAASEELSGQAGLMHDLLNDFNLDS